MWKKLSHDVADAGEKNLGDKMSLSMRKPTITHSQESQSLTQDIGLPLVDSDWIHHFVSVQVFVKNILIKPIGLPPFR